VKGFSVHKFHKLTLRLRHAAVLTVTATVLAACGGGSSDVAGSTGPSNARATLTLVAYSVPEPGWSKVIPAYNATQQGKDIAITTSYGASGDQSRGVVDGKPADIVNFSLEPDVTRLVKAGKVSKDWNNDVTHGIPFDSVVVLVVRKGNPKNIKDWDDLVRPDVEVVTPSPLSSGSAKWNLLAPYAMADRIRRPASTTSSSWSASTSSFDPGRAVRPPTCSCRAAATC
jgi:sulfate transport system substrate-binding protein